MDRRDHVSHFACDPHVKDLILYSPDTSLVTVDIGLDVHVEVPLREAIPLAKQRQEVLLK